MQEYETMNAQSYVNEALMIVHTAISRGASTESAKEYAVSELQWEIGFSDEDRDILFSGINEALDW